MQQPPPQGFYGQPTVYGGYPPVPPPLPPREPSTWQRFRSARKRTQCSIGCATLFLILSLCVCSTAALGAAVGPQKTATLNPTATTMTQPTHIAQIVATSIPTRVPTFAVTPTHTSTQQPTPIPTLAPTQPPAPTSVPTQTPIPTFVPTQAPAPTQPPTGTNGNPWGYSFAPGTLIYSPVAAFCGQYFSCVSTFWTATRGYVVECVNGLYSHSGGIRGACSHDGGPAAILYSH